MSIEIAEILTHKELIAINQDPLGRQGYKIYDEDNLQIWQKPLSNGEMAICLLNLDSMDKVYTIQWAALKILLSEGTYHVRNLWDATPVGDTSSQYTVNVPTRDVVVLRLAKT
jgi:alpha-galactosidase